MTLLLTKAESPFAPLIKCDRCETSCLMPPGTITDEAFRRRTIELSGYTEEGDRHFCRSCDKERNYARKKPTAPPA
jgi:hypothetical protein